MVQCRFMKKIFRQIGRILIIVVLVSSCVLVLSGSILSPGDRTERVRFYTRDIEFGFESWILNALRMKAFEGALGATSYLSDETRHRLVLEYLDLITQIHTTESQINLIYADPKVADPQAASVSLRERLIKLDARRDLLAPEAESILQNQIASIADQMNLTWGGQPLPPVLYRSTPLPWVLIVSPRNAIRADENIALQPGLSIDQRVGLENNVDRATGMSSLVVPIGGLGAYPTMVLETDGLDWLSETISHEWIHNYLELHPLGANYMTTPELRIMNETTASIAGKEIGRAVLEKFYPELVPPAPSQSAAAAAQPNEPPAFDFNKEMHLTRQNVDRLLAEGKIDEAEQYMEMRRGVFWDQGYHIRKLNQAYFAFYGAYADEPIGAAGEDPVGAAVRALRTRSSSLTDFIERISWMYSFDQLKKAVEIASQTP
jgi:hypothetical protein